MYVEKEKLIELIRKAQAGDFSEELVQVVYHIAEGIYQKYDYPIDLDDYKQNAALLVFRKIHRVDVSKQPFNYLTTLVRNAARYATKVQHKYENKLLTYRTGESKTPTFYGLGLLGLLLLFFHFFGWRF